MGILTALDAVKQSERIIDSLRLADDLAFEANRDGGPRTIRVLAAATNDDDQLASIAATHALAQVYDAQADLALSALLSSDRSFLREHAAWALGGRLPNFSTVGRLVGLLTRGGFGGMLAQRTLEQWSTAAPDHIALSLEGALIGVTDADARYRLVETLGLVRASIATRPLLQRATDVTEHESVRVAAVSALGQRRGDREIEPLLEELGREDGYLGDVARLALIDLAAQKYPGSSPERIAVAQLFLHADITAGLENAGRGDNGGIATLLVRLGDALIAGDEVERVVTMSRGSVEDAIASVRATSAANIGHSYGLIPLLSDPVQSVNAWPLRVAARRGIRRLLRAAGGVDVLHLRMADVGSLAAADVARELQIPVVFTVAPDPHALMNTLDLSGRLTRANFGEVDESEHFWYRTRLVQQLASNAAHTVIFPRPHLARDMKNLVGIDISAHPERHTIIPEGIDLEAVDRGVAEAQSFAAGTVSSAALTELSELVSALPPERRGLPLLVSVGRFHRVKGMATIVEAWAASPAGATANLLLIGGDLDNPSADETEQLDLISGIIPRADHASAGLILAGHRPNDTVARWIGATRFGIPGLVAPRGVYVCGSLKEEFGIALLEAMGAGLLVVGPDGGGPATYVAQGDTGFLTKTWNVGMLGEAIAAALAAAAAETGDDRAARSREVVEASFTIQAMATALGLVYARVHADEGELREAAGLI